MEEGYPAETNRPEYSAREAGDGLAEASRQNTEPHSAASQADALLETTADKFLGRWIRLVSTTNWEKGRIIFEWRESLVDAGAPVTAATDEVWSRLVGNVTPQHVGRLRRVYQRFNDTRADYPGLYWSHFQAVLDWDDAEMWLEGAVQNGWSISQMQAERSQTLGALAPPSGAAEEDDIDEDAGQPNVSPDAVTATQAASATIADVRGTDDFVDELASGDAHDDFDSTGDSDASRDGDFAAEDDLTAADGQSPFRPFERLSALPEDMRDAVEGLKLVIVQRRMSGWSDSQREDILAVIEALRQLVLAP